VPPCSSSGRTGNPPFDDLSKRLATQDADGGLNQPHDGPRRMTTTLRGATSSYRNSTRAPARTVWTPAAVTSCYVAVRTVCWRDPVRRDVPRAQRGKHAAPRPCRNIATRCSASDSQRRLVASASRARIPYKHGSTDQESASADATLLEAPAPGGKLTRTEVAEARRDLRRSVEEGRGNSIRDGAPLAGVDLSTRPSCGLPFA